jgi:hypothetical protein
MTGEGFATESDKMFFSRWAQENDVFYEVSIHFLYII